MIYWSVCSWELLLRLTAHTQLICAENPEKSRVTDFTARNTFLPTAELSQKAALQRSPFGA